MRVDLWRPEKEIVNLVAEILYKSRSLLFGDFKLSSGGRSPYYIDLGVLPSKPRYFKVLTSLMTYKLEEVGEPQYIAGVPVRGLCIALAIAYEKGIPFIIVRERNKDHGTGKIIEGDIEEGASVAVIDDVATTGASISRTIDILEAHGLKVKYASAVIDREELASKVLEERGVPFYPLVKITQVVETMLMKGYISKGERGKILNYLNLRKVEIKREVKTK